METADSSRDLVTRAAEFSRAAHEGQLRASGEPFATHPAAAAEILIQHGVQDAEVLAAAYLHDVLEDTAVDAAQLRTKFGPIVTRLVEELTNRTWPGRTPQQKQDALLQKARSMSDAAKLLKLADRLHNVREMTAWNEQRQKKYAERTMELLEALQPWPCPALAEEVRKVAASHL